MDKHFDIAREEEIYKHQEQAGCFKAGAGKAEGSDPFTIMIPPPNVTGSLHMGHALNNTLQDIVVRRKRMQGYNVLWQVGSDHAGIATQAVVERQLETKGLKRANMSREEFIKHVWEWKEQSGGTIMHQLRRLGASCDFSRERFTMDEGLSKAVRHVFVSLYEQGLIYKDKRLVNWDCALQTAISDIEVIPTDQTGNLWYFRYDIADKECGDDSIIIATTRPETMFGDTAIAVHPEDERYKHLIGKYAILPITNRLIPIIADDYADPTLGTGAVKITPAHDFNDFEVGKRHHLEVINILNPNGTLNENVPIDYQGMDRFEARKKIIAELQSQNILTEIKPHPNKIPLGDRSGTVIEPYLTEQWYVNVTPLAEKAVKAVQTGKTNFIPSNWDKTYYHWLENIQPWCISRQLWWGHQIPAYYAADGTVFVAETIEEATAKAKAHFGTQTDLTQDQDVLDTWFSSALWPFSTLGWPEKTIDFDTYYPTQLLITGFDIIFFWVARMMMMGVHFTDKTPFKDVYIHALVRDEKGQKMSKSKGNVLDPLVLINEFGADAVRFTLCAMAAQGRDIKLSTSRIEGYRNFVTKIWNASRFAQMNGCVYNAELNVSDLKIPACHWILNHLSQTLKQVDDALDGYRFNDAAFALYHFTWGTVCDWFIEMVKPYLADGADAELRAEVQGVLGYVLRHVYVMLHPMMPFITDALHQDMGFGDKALTLTTWPDLRADSLSADAIEAIDFVVSLIEALRSMRTSIQVPASVKITLYVKDYTVRQQEFIIKNQDIILKMARLEAIIFDTNYVPSGVAGVNLQGLLAFAPVSQWVDMAKERTRLEKDLEKNLKELDALDKRLQNPQFIAKADSIVIEETQETRLQKHNAVKKLQEILVYFTV